VVNDLMAVETTMRRRLV